MTRLAFLILMAVAGTAAAQSYQVLPAPKGDAVTVALRAIRDAEHPCPKVTRASRLPDQSILATCSNRESYLVFAILTKSREMLNVAMRCSAVKELGIASACPAA